MHAVLPGRCCARSFPCERRQCHSDSPMPACPLLQPRRCRPHGPLRNHWLLLTQVLPGMHDLAAVSAGVASLSAAVQRAGGSTELPGDALDDALEQLAAYIEVSAVQPLSSTPSFVKSSTLEIQHPLPRDAMDDALEQLSAYLH